MRYLIAALILLSMSLPPTARAQLYKWTNERGEVHFTEGIESVPQRFRAGAVVLGHPSAPTATTPAPPPVAEPGTAGAAGSKILARIPFVPGVPIIVNARINAGRNVQLLLDTGADRTMISPSTLSALGVDITRGVRRGTLRSVTGSVDADVVTLESLEVGEARVSPLEVYVHNPNLTRGEGLLGRDFLDRFAVNIDTGARVVIISRR